LKLQTKLALYNAISKAAIIAVIGVVLPIILQRVVLNHIDNRLRARSEKMMHMIQRGGISEIITEQDCSFNDYNIFKEEYVSINPLKAFPKNFGTDTIFNAAANIENEMVNHRILSKAFLYDNQLYEMNIGEGLTTVEELDGTLRKFSITILIIVVLASIFIDIGFAEILLRPFYKIINQKLQNVHHPSKFKEEIIKTNTFEFAYLDKSINEMMQKVKNAFLVEREFITNVSHELLTPISILQNRCENILAEPSLPENIAMKIIETQKTLSRLSRVVKALLYISKIENEQFAKNENASLKALVQDVLVEIEERLESKNIFVEQIWTEDFELKNCNKSLLHTMIFNLISNAIKYNKENGQIIIAGRKENSCYSLSVTDTGVGIDKEHVPYIFDRFKRFRPEDETSYGLGLPIIQSIADFHHLKVSVNSEVNKGTTFIVYFPPMESITAAS
jgi:signal transduction histidine kinase